ncbi:single-stranded DNA-binding protein [Apilactobacillus sp. 1-1-2]|uniref:single-stranded DNA-binding protein n=1 Tax=Apilactobacillus sp. 1-1-2 TaxID=3411035 RepID=UPI003B95BE65
MINRTVLTGRLTDDIDLRYTPSGSAVGNFRLALNRRFTNQNGEREADFINCVVWKKTAENLANFTHKGTLIGVDGRIQTRTYDDKDGKKVYITEVVVEQFALLEPRQDNQVQQTQQNNMSPFDNPSNPVDITDDDLPF